MSIYYQDDKVVLHHGDCLDVLATLPDASVDAVVTDPPYGLANTDPAHVAETITRWVNGERDYLPGGSGFMGKEWDAFIPPVAVWDECLRVLKPGGHVLAFAGSRTVDLMTLGLRLAGFDIRDSLAWLYGSGFPKSMDVSKAIDKRGGRPELAAEIGSAIKAARISRGMTAGEADARYCGGSTNWSWFEGRKGVCRPPTPETFARIVEDWPELAPYAEAINAVYGEVVGSKVSGIGTAFGDGEWASGAAQVVDIVAPATPAAERWEGWGTALKPAHEPVVMARKPLAGTVAANVLEHGTGALNIDATRIDMGADYEPNAVQRQSSSSAGMGGLGESGYKANHEQAKFNAKGRWPANVVLDESQSEVLEEQSGVSRFFYVAKAPKSERPVVDGVAHPTVKPVSLMSWLVRLATPPGGTVLEPFAGSGTTVEAAMREGFHVVAVEREADYLPLIRARIDREHARQQAEAEAHVPDLFDGLEAS